MVDPANGMAAELVRGLVRRSCDEQVRAALEAAAAWLVHPARQRGGCWDPMRGVETRS